MVTPSSSQELPWLPLATLHPRQSVLLGLMQATCQTLAEAEVECWLTGGTLLGFMRHGGFVPHDDDVDLECLESDAARIEAAFATSDLLVFRYGGRWNETPVAHVGLRGTDVELDIFLREDALEELKDFPSSVEIYPLCADCFHGVEILRPANPQPFLRRLYGADWATTVRVWTHDFNFQQGLGHDPDKVSITVEAYEALVREAGYRPPGRLDPDAATALRSLLEEGGPAAALRKAREESWLDTLRRKNREQADARARLREQEQAEQVAGEAGDE